MSIYFDGLFAATIRYDFKKVLKKHLGSSWQQLARRMGVPKGGVDAIAVKYPNELPVQVDEFLNTYKFPYVGSDKETADLLIDILMSASLTPVATNVKRDLEFELDLEGTQIFYKHTSMLTLQSDYIIFNYTYLTFVRHWINWTLLTSSGRIYSICIALHYSRYQRML